MLDWNDLRFFLALVRAGSAIKAGKGLGVDATTVGRRIEALEQRLSARLFDRRPSGWTLNETGRGILQEVEGIEARVLGVESKVHGEDGRLEGRVRLTCTETFLVHNVAPLLPEFTRRYPEIALEIVASAAAVSLSRRDADVAVRLTRPLEESVFAQKAGVIAIAPHATEGYLAERGMPEAQGGFAGHDFIGYSGGARAFPEARWVEQHAPGARQRIRVSSIPAVEAAVLSGAGIGLVPCFVADAHPALRRVGPPVVELRRDIWLLVHRNLRRAARVRAVLDFLHERLKAAGPQLRGEAGAPVPARKRVR